MDRRFHFLIFCYLCQCLFCLSFCLSICLAFCLSVRRLQICLFVCLSLSVCVHVCVSMSLYQSMCVCQYTCSKPIYIDRKLMCTSGVGLLEKCTFSVR